MSPKVAVVVVTYNSGAVVADLLDSLPEALGNLDAETAIVDNGSADDTVRLVSARDDCRVIRGSNVGYAAGVNRGVAEFPDAHAILVLNPDVILDPESVPRMLAALNRPGVGIVAPLTREMDGSLSWSLRREPTLLRALGLGRTQHPALSEYVTSPTDYATGRTADWAVGAILLISRECHDAVGGWDESYFLYSEETDFCLRARDLGFETWFEPSAQAMHIGGASGTSARTQAMQATNRVRLYRRRHGPVASALYYTLTIASELSRWTRGNPHSAEVVQALLSPTRRPAQLGLMALSQLVPR